MRLSATLLTLALAQAATGASAATMFVSDASSTLGYVDTDTGNVTVVGTLGDDTKITDIAFDPLGRLFGISYNSFYQINPKTGQSTLIGSHGIGGANALVYGNGKFYTAGQDADELYTIDPDFSSLSGSSVNYSSVGRIITSEELNGYPSAGDLAFIGGELFFATIYASLVKINLSNTMQSTLIGEFDSSNFDIFGIATDGDSGLFGVAGTDIFSVNSSDATTTDLVSFAGKGLGQAYGMSFFGEAGASGPPPTVSAVPVPLSAAFLLTALAALALRRKAS